MQSALYISGSGMTPFGEHWEMSIQDLMDEAMTEAFENSDCNSLDIDTVIVANMLGERTNGQAHLGSLAANLLPHHPPALRVESACASGGIALNTACALLESGRAETVMVLGVEKMTDVPVEEISTGLMSAADAEKDSPSGLTFPGIFGLITSRYMHEYGLTREELSLVSAQHHKNAVNNPCAQFRNTISAKQISKSPLIADPLHMLDCSPISDGAAAIILSTKFASSLQIAASQIATDTVSLIDRETITSFAATRNAATQAFAEAEITQEDIAHIEMHDCFSIAALINLEDLGYAEPGQGISFYKRKHERTVNDSGGLKACGHPVGATGVKQVIDASKQLTKSKKRYALTQNFGGACASCAIHIIEQFAMSN
jgi:acetyl-CoA C-acetyltransferase